jgi:hypothetical protein
VIRHDKEFHRVLKDGGFAALSTHAQPFTNHLTQEIKKKEISLMREENVKIIGVIIASQLVVSQQSVLLQLMSTSPTTIIR